jgi:Flp pilus assembly protein TadD
MEHFKKVTELAPDEPTVHYRLASIYKRMGRKDEERDEMELFRKLKAARKDKDIEPESN